MKPVIFYNCYPDDKWRLGWVKNIYKPVAVKRLGYNGTYYPAKFLNPSMGFKIKYTNASNHTSYTKHNNTHYFSVVIMGVLFLFKISLED